MGHSNTDCKKKKCTFTQSSILTQETTVWEVTYQVGCNILWNHILYMEGECHRLVFAGLQLAFHNTPTITQRQNNQFGSTITYSLTSFCSCSFRTFLNRHFCSRNSRSTLCLRTRLQVRWRYTERKEAWKVDSVLEYT